MNHQDSLESVRGMRVLITGAAQGMGAIFARMAAAEGAQSMFLWDIKEELLQRTADELRQQHPQVAIHAQVVDLSSRAPIERAAEKVRHHGEVQVLINNAGVVTGGAFTDQEPDHIEATLAVNTLAPMYLASHFLPGMLASRGPGRILTIASAAALVSNPNMSVYAASKAAVLTWSDSVRLELERARGHQVKITSFCPTYVSTGMFAGVNKMLFTPILSPEQVARKAWEAMLRGTPIVLMPWTSKLGQVLRGLLPTSLWDRLAGGPLGIYRSMDGFTGRTAAQSQPRPDGRG